MISLIVCMDENNLIGANNYLPWHYKEDLQFFKETTTGHTVLFGKNTLLGMYEKTNKLLANRKTICLSTSEILIDGVTTYKNIDDLLKQESDFFVCGGASIYEQLIDFCDILYITKINKSFEGDTYFPNVDFSKFRLINKKDSGELSFLTYEKI